MLSVWMHGIRVATLEKRRHARLRLTYTDDALQKYGLGAPLLSLAFPTRPEPYPHGATRAFLDGLLPEGEARLVIARKFTLDRDDTYGLVQAIGRDCAGAIVIQPGDEPPPRANTRAAARLDDGELGALVADLRSAPLGVAEDVRVSLGGVQEKLLLTRMPDGSWGKPIDGTPSTHILKPEIAAFPNTVANEAFCMRVAKHLGLSVAEVEVTTVGGRELLVVERYDRIVDEKGDVERLHQEDFCQITGRSPDRKYEEDSGPTLREVTSILQTQDPGSVEPFLHAVTLNVAIGNGDAHAKNFSLLHLQTGAVRLTPLYDLMSTVGYGGTKLAMYIDDVRQIAKVTGDRIVNEASRWGIARPRIVELIEAMSARIPDAVRQAQAEFPHVPDSIPDLIFAQVENIRNRLG